MTFTIGGVEHSIEVDIPDEQAAEVSALIDQGDSRIGEALAAATAGSMLAKPVAASTTGSEPAGTGHVRITAPLAGAIARVLVTEGDQVEAGQVVTVLEAVKMETDITAPRAGKVLRVLVQAQDAVQGGQPLIELD